MKPTDLARYLTLYLTSYLPVIRGLSTNTIASRRDTFSLFLVFLRDEKKLPSNKVDISMLSVEIINDFLQWLENSRGSSISTRNFRLSSLKAFFGYLQTLTPDYIYLC